MAADILILGKGGQVGSALTALLGDGAMVAGREEADMASPDFIEKLNAFVGHKKLSAVINAAAYTQVDKAEGDGREDAFRVNRESVGKLAQWCLEKNTSLIHYSTDYVFDGGGTHARAETEEPRPVNAYGQSKLEGERAIEVIGGNYIILRTSWVYDDKGKNFFNTMRRLMGERESLKVVADQVGAPTYALHLAKATLEILHKTQQMSAFPSGVYHLCNAGETSWHGFANAILALEKARNPDVMCKNIEPIATSEYPLPAPRPLNSRLDCTKAHEVFGITMPDWREGLEECFAHTYPHP